MHKCIVLVANIMKLNINFITIVSILYNIINNFKFFGGGKNFIFKPKVRQKCVSFFLNLTCK